MIANRVPTAWGALSIVEAELLLLREALKDPLNDRQGSAVQVAALPAGNMQPRWAWQPHVCMADALLTC